MIDYTCASCDEPLSAPDSRVGQRDLCPHCKWANLIPTPAPVRPEFERSFAESAFGVLGIIILLIGLTVGGIVIFFNVSGDTPLPVLIGIGICLAGVWLAAPWFWLAAVLRYLRGISRSVWKP